MESALLRPFFPTVGFLRVDGLLSGEDRAAVVDRFVTDPSVVLLLLTTRVGHLGLNLSVANMVVFLEHDWNPQVDLQVRAEKNNDCRVGLCRLNPYCVRQSVLLTTKALEITLSVVACREQKNALMTHPLANMQRLFARVRSNNCIREYVQIDEAAHVLMQSKLCG